MEGSLRDDEEPSSDLRDELETGGNWYVSVCTTTISINIIHDSHYAKFQVFQISSRHKRFLYRNYFSSLVGEVTWQYEDVRVS